jgi:hypothetical protein
VLGLLISTSYLCSSRTIDNIMAPIFPCPLGCSLSPYAHMPNFTSLICAGEDLPIPGPWFSIQCDLGSSTLTSTLTMSDTPDPSLIQWLFSPSALRATPTTSNGFATLERELYDRSRGVEFLYRLGSSLGL